MTFISIQKTLFFIVWLFLVFFSNYCIDAVVNRNSDTSSFRLAYYDWKSLSNRSSKIGFYDVFFLNSNYNNSVDFIVIGDSHAEQYLPYFLKYLSNKNILYLRARGCNPLDLERGKAGKLLSSCASSNIELFNFVKSKVTSNTKIVVAYCWNCLFDKLSSSNINELKFSLHDYLVNLDEFVLERRRLYFILDNPSGIQFSPKQMLSNGVKDVDNLYVSIDTSQNETANLLLDSLKDFSFTVVDPRSELCIKRESIYSSCLAIRNYYPVYKDSDHVNATYVSTYLRYLDSIL